MNCSLLSGPRWHWSRHGAADVCYTPESFMQSNTGSYNALLAALGRHVPPGAAVSELYAGAGAIGLSIAAAAEGSRGMGAEGGDAGEISGAWASEGVAGGAAVAESDSDSESASETKSEVEAEARAEAEVEVDAASRVSKGVVAAGSDGVAASDGGSWSSDVLSGAGSVRCVECVAAAAETFEVSAQRLPPEVRRLVSFEVARADQAVGRAVKGADALIVDPPRKGLDCYTLAALTGGGGGGDGDGGHAASTKERKKPSFRNVASGPAGAGRKKRNRRRRRESKDAEGRGGSGDSSRAERGEVPCADADVPPPPERLKTLIYVSCGFASFERDANALLASGLWEVAHAEGFNFFPGGDALEVLAVFHRRA